MSTLYPRLPNKAAKERYLEIRALSIGELTGRSDTTHLAQYFAPTGGGRATPERLSGIRTSLVDIATDHGFPEARPSVNKFDTAVARTLHAEMDLVPAEAAVRPLWAFLALVVLPDVTVWRFPQPPEDRVLATDITRHAFGRLWWRAHLLREEAWVDDPYHLLDVFPERNFDQILTRRRSIGGSPALVRALAKEWPKNWDGFDESKSLINVLKHLMRRGAIQDLFGLPEDLLRPEIARSIATVRYRGPRVYQAADPGLPGKHARS